MGPKFGPVREIAFHGYPFVLPNTEHAVEEQLHQLPNHFYHQPVLGLGLRWQFRPMIGVLGRNGFRRLVISRSKDYYAGQTNSRAFGE
jgi:hypothetical protein